jgi:fibronectin type 3 domain-containing protein
MKSFCGIIATAALVLFLSCVVADAQSPNTITLVPGWNLISLPVQPANTSIASVLSGIKGAYEAVWAYPNQTWQVYDPNDTAGSTLTTMQAGNGYWIKVTSGGTLSVAGSTPTSSPSLLEGWNLVGYNGTSCTDALAALFSLGSALQAAWGYAPPEWEFYEPGSSTLAQFCPGAGYWIDVSQAGAWTLPSSGTYSPTGLTVTPGSGQAVIAWTAVTDATSYNIYWSTTSGVTQANGNKITGAANPYTQSSLTDGIPYYYVVTAVNAVGETAPSTQVSAIPSAKPSPAAPAAVTVTAGDGQAVIAWTAVSGATSYNIYWSTTAGVTPANGTKIPGATSPYTHTPLTNGTTYYYTVTAVNGNGESTATTQASCTPSALPVPTGVALTPGYEQETIAWTAVPGAIYYNIYWSTTPGVSKANGTRITHANSPYTQTGLIAGKAYYYVVTAVTSAGESKASAQVSSTPSATPPTPPSVPISFDLQDPLPVEAHRCADFSYLIPTPTGGAGGPYTFNLGTGSFPPLGIFVNMGGDIAGVDASPMGSYPFDVCVTDAVFTEKCQHTSITVTTPIEPVTPSGPSPANGATGVSTKPTLSWAASTNANYYEVDFGAEYPPPEVLKDWPITSDLLTTPLKTNTTYYWQIWAYHNMCDSLPPTASMGPSWSFTTGGVSGTYNGTLSQPGADYPGCPAQTISFSLTLTEGAGDSITGSTSNDRTITSGSITGDSITVNLSTMFGPAGPYTWTWDGANTITGSMVYYCYDLSTYDIEYEGTETFSVTR